MNLVFHISEDGSEIQLVYSFLFFEYQFTETVTYF